MTMDITCFMLKPTNRALLYLRKFQGCAVGSCLEGSSYHDARVCIGEMQPAEEAVIRAATAEEREDKRWPTVCSKCHRPFGDSATHQRFVQRLYSRDDGSVMVLDEAPPGAMWDADWYGDHRVGPDGLHLVVRLPDGNEWFIDGPATNGPGWTRTGVAPKLTVTPSIATPTYHGWLRDGKLVSA